MDAGGTLFAPYKAYAPASQIEAIRVLKIYVGKLDKVDR